MPRATSPAASDLPSQIAQRTLAHVVQRPAPHPCLVGARVALRPQCLGCDGRPDTGQRLLERGDVCVMQGDPATHLFAVVEGFLRESTYDADGRAVAARIVGPGHVLGLAALNPTPSSYVATIEVLSRARVCILPADRARAWFTEHASFALDLAVLAAADLDHLRRDLALRAQPADDRVLALITELVRASTSDPLAWVRLPATREQLGEVLGLTLETVSRAVQRLVARGHLELRGRDLRLISTHDATTGPADPGSQPTRSAEP